MYFKNGHTKNDAPSLLARVSGREDQEILHFDLTQINTNDNAIPKPNMLPDTPGIDTIKLKNLATRSFSLAGVGMNNGRSINNRTFNKTKINFDIKKGTQKIWKVNNIPRGSMMSHLPHSFHVHGTQFKVISYNRSPPPIEMQGLKDTVLVMPNVELKLLVQFHSQSDGIYLYHCHLLEHEDSGMMGQLNVN